jgi:hypothetical protein
MVHCQVKDLPRRFTEDALACARNVGRVFENMRQGSRKIPYKNNVKAKNPSELRVSPPWFHFLKFMAPILCFFLAAAAFGQTISINGALDWNKMEMEALISLNLASANIKLPAGRTLGETLISSEYLKFIMPGILELQVDSSSTLTDLAERGEFSFIEVEGIVLGARSTSPFLSADLLSLSSSYTIGLDDISTKLLRHSRPAEIRRILNPVSAPAYTGIIIIANSPLPVHGMKSSALAVPCLFPKIWDTNMNLIYERNMLEAGRKAMIRYAPARGIFEEGPTGLSGEIAALVGSRPLRIIARGLYGINPTDPVIDAQDALAIISTEENRRLLSEGKVLIILDGSQMTKSITKE